MQFTVIFSLEKEELALEELVINGWESGKNTEQVLLPLHVIHVSSNPKKDILLSFQEEEDGTFELCVTNEQLHEHLFALFTKDQIASNSCTQESVAHVASEVRGVYKRSLKAVLSAFAVTCTRFIQGLPLLPARKSAEKGLFIAQQEQEQNSLVPDYTYVTGTMNGGADLYSFANRHVGNICLGEVAEVRIPGLFELSSSALIIHFSVQQTVQERFLLDMIMKTLGLRLVYIRPANLVWG